MLKYSLAVIFSVVLFLAGYIFGVYRESTESASTAFNDEMYDAIHYAYVLKALDEPDSPKARVILEKTIKGAILNAHQAKNNLNSKGYTASCALITYIKDHDLLIDNGKDLASLDEVIESWKDCKKT